MTLTGIRTEPVAPGSPEWLTTISASKVAAIMGLSKWDSPSSLYNQIKGIGPAKAETAITRRGHYLEPAVAAWFADQHPEYEVTDGGSWHHPEHPEWTCTPDRLVKDAGVEIKSDGYGGEWGEEGTAEIPIGYLVQVAWQIIVTGLPKIYVPMIGPFLDFKEYVVTIDDVAEDIPLIIECVEDFQWMLANDTPPPPDEHPRTYEAFRERHPDIVPGEKAEVSDDLAAQYLRAIEAKKAAEAKELAAKSKLIDAMGNAKTATWNGQTLANRQSRNGGTPYIVAAKKLPVLTEQEVAA